VESASSRDVSGAANAFGGIENAIGEVLPDPWGVNDLHV
jgi:hypothetical protein